MIQMFLFWTILIPANPWFTLASLKPLKWTRSSRTRVDLAWGWMIPAQLSIMYFGTSASKLATHTWNTGKSIWSFALTPHTGWWPAVFFLYLGPSLIQFITQMLPWCQRVMGVLYLIPYKKPRLIAVILSLFLHLGIQFTLWAGNISIAALIIVAFCLHPDYVDWIIGKFKIHRLMPAKHTSVPVKPQSKKAFLITVILSSLFVLCQIDDASDHVPALQFKMPQIFRPPLLYELKRSIFRGEHWGMYTSDVYELLREVYVAETDEGFFDISWAFEYPWYAPAHPERPKLEMKYFLGSHAPLLHRQIRQTLYTRIARLGASEYGSFFGFYKKRFESRFPGLIVKRIHVIFVQKKLPPIGQMKDLNTEDGVSRYRYTTWTAPGFGQGSAPGESFNNVVELITKNTPKSTM